MLDQRWNVWMGPKGSEAWYRTPSNALDMSPAGWSTEAQQLGGGLTLAASDATHVEYNFAWDPAPRAQLQPIIDMATQARAFSELVYYVDPFAAHENALPAHWATPALQALDAPPWTPAERPTLANTGANSKNLPLKTAVFDGTVDTPRTLYLPSPPGYFLRVGFYGPVATSDVFTLKRLSGTSTLTTTDLNVIANSSYGQSMTATDGDETGVEIALKEGTLSDLGITAGIAQYVPVGESPTAPSKFIGGTGHSGLQLVGSFMKTGYAPQASLIGISARFAEVGDWL